MTDTTQARPSKRARRARERGGEAARRTLDFATVLGLFFAIALVAAAIALSGSIKAFFDLPSVLMVVLGTLAITAISYTGTEIVRAFPSFSQALLRNSTEPSEAAHRILQLADKARKVGVLQLQPDLAQLRSQPFLQRSLMQVIDGMPVDEVERNAQTEIMATMASRQQAAFMLRRAAEVAPAMGLIGTLVGLVQMLGNLDSPETIGPSMSVALLTTLYGALMANVVFLPLANKLERNASVEQLAHQVYATGVVSIGRQENPRRLEMLLNTMLPVGSQVRYFD